MSVTFVKPSNLGDEKNPHMVAVLPQGASFNGEYSVEAARCADGKVSGTIHFTGYQGKEAVRGGDVNPKTGKRPVIGYKRLAKVSTSLVLEGVPVEEVLDKLGKVLTTGFNIDEGVEDRIVLTTLKAKREAKAKAPSLEEQIAIWTAEGLDPAAIMAKVQAIIAAKAGA